MKAIIYNCKTFQEEIIEVPDIPVENPEQQKQDILNELAQLDSILPRYAEDLYVATETTPYEKYQEIISKKNELRARLKELSV